MLTPQLSTHQDTLGAPETSKELPVRSAEPVWLFHLRVSRDSFYSCLHLSEFLPVVLGCWSPDSPRDQRNVLSLILLFTQLPIDFIHVLDPSRESYFLAPATALAGSNV